MAAAALILTTPVSTHAPTPTGSGDHPGSGIDMSERACEVEGGRLWFHRVVGRWLSILADDFGA